MTRSKTTRKKSPKGLIGNLSKGSLTKYGYSSRDSTEDRHKALKKAAKVYGPEKLVLKLNAVCVLNKNRAPTLSKIFCRDKKWVQKTFSKVKSRSRKPCTKTKIRDKITKRCRSKRKPGFKKSSKKRVTN
jgi:hypothetical protein